MVAEVPKVYIKIHTGIHERTLNNVGDEHHMRGCKVLVCFRNVYTCYCLRTFTPEIILYE